jgi:transcriptional regulator with XRE-family HTH domain
VAEMAAYLGVSRRSVGNWINGHVEPGTQTLRLWAMRCGPPVTYEWLRTGVTAGQPGSGIQCFSPRPVTIRLRRAA